MIAKIVIKIIGTSLKGILDGLLGGEKGKNFYSIINLIIIAGAILKGIESAKLVKTRYLRLSFIKLINNFLDILVNVLQNSLSFIVIVLIGFFIITLFSSVLIQNKKVS